MLHRKGRARFESARFGAESRNEMLRRR